ncbi:RND family efflux transporter MFP subunit [Sinobacterium caligoides]|uniref:RND family efflux transporter MFP subunit n=1 Tax=Sinobacterium caligoides TaxID=933926 RepID=A0A3N2DQ85_9GAMM|nr:efflux RND transporter periplasmic adaptor subunit [Sinobacterium caligoides]ROS01986.1 RND family efflux transporter MFP subunit [Sinobacterium caligoides]
MNKKIVLPSLTLLLGAAAVYGLMFGRPTPTPQQVLVSPPPVVQTFVATPQTVQLQVESQGSIRPHRQIDLVAQVGGKVVEVDADFLDGAFFPVGQQLLMIEQADYRFALVKARAKVFEAQEALATTKGMVLQAKREWRDLGNAEANALFLKEPQLRAAEARLEAAKSEQQQAELALARTIISTPFAGRIQQTLVNLGQYVAPGTPVARIYATDRVEVKLPLTDRQVALLDLPLHYQGESIGQQPAPLAVTLSAQFAARQWQWRAEVRRTDASIDVQNRVVYAVAEVANPFARDLATRRPPLMVGQFVQASIEGRELDNVLLLPRRALQPGNKLWLVDDDNRLQALTVELLQATRQQVAVRATVEGAVRVLVSALDFYVEGLEVLPQPMQEAGDE